MNVIIILLLAGFLRSVDGQVAGYGECGGIGYTGQTSCAAGYTCSSNNPYYWQCTPIPVPPGQQGPYGQCGGIGYNGLTQCSAGYSCIYSNPYYSQCLPASALSIATESSSSFSLATSTSSSSSTSATWTIFVISSSSIVDTSPLSSASSTSASMPISSSSSPTTPPAAQQIPYGQCGGTGYTGPTQCSSGWTCTYNNPYYSQCLPSILSSSPPASSPTSISSTVSSTSANGSSKTVMTASQSRVSCAPSPVSCSDSNSPPACAGKVSLSGINIAGFDFGMGTDGSQTPSGAYPPLGPDYGLPDGPGQMIHFVNDDGLNVFRLPVGWQYLINNADTASGTLDPTNFGNYNILVQDCLATGAYCLVDIHNYARFDGAIIGQGGPTNEIFASLWRSLATEYANQSKVIFGIMNEPHDLNSITTWAATVQSAVTAIGATTQMILLPGTDYASVEYIVSDGSAAALSTVTNPDGSYTNLIFDIHKYLDSDGSGTSSTCVDSYISVAFAPLAQWLRCNGRQALLSETGGGNTASCVDYLCQTVAYLNANSDVYLGYIGWAAGSFATSYILSETPTENNGIWTDQEIVTSCLIP